MCIKRREVIEGGRLMQTKRVGTISMAIILIGFGLLLFLAQFNKISAIELGVKFWPLSLIIIGGEILYFSHIGKKEEDFIIRYDIFSIFMVMIILVVNIGLYGLIETEILDLIKLRVGEEKIIYEEYLEE